MAGVSFPLSTLCGVLLTILSLQRLGDVINHWRRKTLNLEPLPSMIGPRIAEILKVPYTYCWSPALVPKPLDWPSYIGKADKCLVLFFLSLR
jgi:hypothetical protein